MTDPLETPAEAVFGEPWEARAFALVLALSAGGSFSLDEFRARLIAAIARTDALPGGSGAARPYYESWLAALGQMLTDKRIIEAAELTERAAAIAAAPPAPTRMKSAGPVTIA